jgi:murein DD-endopeptidase MepM/ murein hydrolase activator NlpD
MTNYVLPFPKTSIPKGGDFGNKEAPRTNAHRGVDFAIAGGTKIKSASNGKVVVNKWSAILGNVVAIEDPKGIVWGYCHLRDASPLKLGASVEAGKTIVGLVGNTGSASRGAHLHFTCGSDINSPFQGWVQDPIACLERQIAKEKPVAKPVEVVAPVAEEAPAAEVATVAVDAEPAPSVPKTAAKPTPKKK